MPRGEVHKRPRFAQTVNRYLSVDNQLVNFNHFFSQIAVINRSLRDGEI